MVPVNNFAYLKFHSEQKSTFKMNILTTGDACALPPTKLSFCETYDQFWTTKVARWSAFYTDGTNYLPNSTKPKCLETAKNDICSSVYAPCTDNGLTQPVCTAVCQQANSTCQNYQCVSNEYTASNCFTLVSSSRDIPPNNNRLGNTIAQLIEFAAVIVVVAITFIICFGLVLTIVIIVKLRPKSDNTYERFGSENVRLKEPFVRKKTAIHEDNYETSF